MKSTIESNNTEAPARIDELLRRGVVIPHPSSVFVDASIDAERIAPGVTLHPGTRLSGTMTSIGPGCVLGTETPVTLDNMQLGHHVTLRGGFFQGSVFLDGANMGSAAHIRAGCLLEEEANGAHAVGLKQTILLPFVTLGSLVNFCDILMAGGTSRSNHSEVGSSFIHFNFTPHGDKATASLIGDVPRGVMMDQAPIFLGGQGGLVGPVRVEYGCILGAGSVARRDITHEGHLVLPGALPGMDTAYDPMMLGSLSARVKKNVAYIGNVAALRCWYRSFRKAFMSNDPYRHACWEGALDLLDGAIAERIKRLGSLATLAGDENQTHPDARNFGERWPVLQTALEQVLSAPHVEPAMVELGERLMQEKSDYVSTIKNLDPIAQRTLVTALQQRVEQVVACVSALKE